MPKAFGCSGLARERRVVAWGPPDGRQEMQDRADETEVLGGLPHALVENVLEWLDADDLGRVAMVSTGLHVLANEEPLWMVLALRLFGGDVQHCGPSWKQTCLGRRRVLSWRQGKATISRRFLSPHLSNRWIRSNMALDNFVPTIEHVPRLFANDPRLAPFNFALHFDLPRAPVVVQGATAGWRCHETWTIENLAARFSDDVKWEVSHGVEGVKDQLKMSMRDYLTYARNQRDETPLYIFDGMFGEKAPDMLADFQVSSLRGLASEDYLAVLGDHARPKYRWFVCGPARTGAPWHKDPHCTSAWNALISGHKRWALYPPSRWPPQVGGAFNLGDGGDPVDVDSPSSLRWFLDVYPTLSEADRPIEVLQKPGDVIFIPSGWWHMVLNLDMTVSVTQNFLNRGNVRAGLHDLHGQRGLSFTGPLCAKLVATHPHAAPVVSRVAEVFESGFDSEYEFVESFSDLELWRPRLEAVMEKHGLVSPTGCPWSFLVLTKRMNPTFVEVSTGVVVKFYSYFSSQEAQFGCQTTEPAIPHDGRAAKDTEAALLLNCERNGISAPRLVAHGVYFGPGHEDSETWCWPYVVMTHVEGRSLASCRKERRLPREPSRCFGFGDDESDYTSPSCESGPVSSNHSAVTEPEYTMRFRCAVPELPRWLGQQVAKLHFMPPCPELVRKPKYEAFLTVQREYAVSGHWRRGTVPIHLLATIGDFVDRYFGSLTRPEVKVMLHGDLQEENVLVLDPAHSKMERAANMLAQVMGDHPAADMVVDLLVRREKINSDALALLEPHHLAELGLPLGPRLVLESAIMTGRFAQGRGRHGHCLPWLSEEPSPSSIIDFADAFVGDPKFDLVALHVSAFQCDKLLLRQFLVAYNDHCDRAGNPRIDFLDPEFACRMLCLAMLHPCDALSVLFRSERSSGNGCNKAVLQRCRSWHEVAGLLFDLCKQ